MNPNELTVDRRISRLRILLALVEVTMFLVALLTIMGSICFLLITLRVVGIYGWGLLVPVWILAIGLLVACRSWRTYLETQIGEALETKMSSAAT